MRTRSAFRRRAGAGMVFVLAALAGISPTQAATPVARLPKVGTSAFWPATAVNIDSAGQAWYRIAVARGGSRLRVAVTRPECCSYVELELRDPKGRSATGYTHYLSAEVSVPNPMPGTWIVRIATYDPSIRDYRFRARLEPAAPRPPSPAKLMLPNLRLIPPYEFTFHSPNLAVDRELRDVGLRRPAGTEHVDSCTPDDAAHTAATAKPAHRCLRFSVGPANTGAGPFQIRFAPTAGSAAVAGTAMQRLYYSDGRVVERAAGTYRYHETHRHYHHTGMGSLELYRVTNTRTGALVPAGQGPKQGFCTADVMIASWRTFNAAPADSTESTCDEDMMQYGSYAPTGTVMGISPGWADLYLWMQDGNFIDFGTNPDGRYVVRSTTDVAGVILESNERDNTSYAYIEVTGNRVRVLERGYGLSPWDRSKQPAGDILRSNPRGFE